MTVIAVAVGTTGAAMAADGRVWLRNSEETVSDDQQKIFPFLSGGAFAITGWAVGKNFNLVDLTQDTVSRMAPPLEFTSALDMFAKGVNCGLVLAQRRGQIFAENEEQSDPVKRSTIARLVLVTESPSGALLATLRFRHRKQNIEDSVFIEVRELRPGAMFLMGSDLVAKSLYGERGQRKPLNSRSSLQDAINCVIQYVETCASAAGAALDPWCRVHAGGHVHVAVLSQGKFQWYRQPAQRTTGE